MWTTVWKTFGKDIVKVYIAGLQLDSLNSTTGIC